MPETVLLTPHHRELPWSLELREKSLSHHPQCPSLLLTYMQACAQRERVSVVLAQERKVNSSENPFSLGKFFSAVIKHFNLVTSGLISLSGSNCFFIEIWKDSVHGILSCIPDGWSEEYFPFKDQEQMGRGGARGPYSVTKLSFCLQKQIVASIPVVI